MRIKFGVNRNARWRDLTDTFSSISHGMTDIGFLSVGGWEGDAKTRDGRRINLMLNEREARQVYDILKRRFEPSEGKDATR